MQNNPDPNRNLDSTLSASSGAVARETAHIRLALEAASNARIRPRREIVEDLLYACGELGFAKSAYYPVPGRDEHDEGKSAPGVTLAREAARCQGHVRYGFNIVFTDKDRMQVRGWAWDLVSGNAVEVDDTFATTETRNTPQGQTVFSLTRDESEWRSTVNKHGAITERAALLKVLPRWLLDRGLAACLETVAQDAAKDTARKIERMVAAFGSLGVNRERLAIFMAKPVDDASAEDLTKMFGIFSSIKDGQSTVASHFNMAAKPAAKKEPEPVAPIVDNSAKPQPVVEAKQQEPQPVEKAERVEAEPLTSEEAKRIADEFLAPVRAKSLPVPSAEDALEELLAFEIGGE